MSLGDDIGYSFAAAAQILDLPESRLRYWSQSGFVGPSLRRAGKQVYSFLDLVSIKAARELVDRGFSTAQIRRTLEAVRGSLPPVDRPLDRLRVAFDGECLVVLEDGAAFEATGQRVFDFGLAELASRAAAAAPATPIAGRAPAAVNPRTAYEWFKEGLRQDAPACYEKALNADPGLAAAHTNLGVLHAGRGNRAAARAAFEAALALDPEQPEARYNLASLMFEAGDVELCAAELRRVLLTAPDFADAHFNLASALERLGGKAQAREHLGRYLALQPGGDGGDAFAGEARTRIARLS